jgi:rubredoxin
MARQIIWVEHIQSWRCSDCAWVFIPSGPPIGNTIDDMKRNFTAKRDKEFKSHVCAKQSGTQAQERRLPKKTE